MKRVQKFNLNELSQYLTVLDRYEQREIIGGGNGSRDYPYTVMEYLSLAASNNWPGGWVYSSGGYVTYVGKYDNCYGQYVNNPYLSGTSNPSAYFNIYPDDTSTSFGNAYSYNYSSISTYNFDGNYSDYVQYQEFVSKGGDVEAFVVKDTIITARQDTSMSCVPTVMEYAYNSIMQKKEHRRDYYVDLYKNTARGRNANVSGVASDDMDAFVNQNFFAKRVYSGEDAISNMNCGYRIIATLENMNVPNSVMHEVFVYGYTKDKKKLIYVEPGDASIRMAPVSSFQKMYVIYDVKR